MMMLRMTFHLNPRKLGINLNMDVPSRSPKPDIVTG